MSRIAVLLGSFLLTFALLSVTWMVAIGRPPGITPQATTPATPTPMPTPTPSATPTPLSALTRAPLPSANPTAAGTAAAGTETRTFVVAGSGFVESQVPEGGSITPSGSGAELQTTESASDSLWVTYRPDLTSLPAGAAIVSVDTRVCGHADGQSWNIEGPAGSTPPAQKLTQPEADGCWHFDSASGADLSVTVSITLASSLGIESVEYTVTFVR